MGKILWTDTQTYARRQTDRQTDWSQYSAPLPGRSNELKSGWYCTSWPVSVLVRALRPVLLSRAALDTGCVEIVDWAAAAEDSSRSFAVFSSFSCSASALRPRRPMTWSLAAAAAAAAQLSPLCRTLRTLAWRKINTKLKSTNHLWTTDYCIISNTFCFSSYFYSMFGLNVLCIYLWILFGFWSISSCIVSRYGHFVFVVFHFMDSTLMCCD